MKYSQLEIRTGIVESMSGDVKVVPDVNFHLIGNCAEWSSSDFEETGVIDSAKVSLSGPDPAGKMSLSIEGWARQSRVSETATFQRWSLEIQ